MKNLDRHLLLLTMFLLGIASTVLAGYVRDLGYANTGNSLWAVAGVLFLAALGGTIFEYLEKDFK